MAFVSKQISQKSAAHLRVWASTGALRLCEQRRFCSLRPLRRKQQAEVGVCARQGWRQDGEGPEISRIQRIESSTTGGVFKGKFGVFS